MSVDTPSALAAVAGGSNTAGEDDHLPPIFDVQRVQMRLEIAASFVAAQVANNVLVLALSSNRILRFDLDNPEDIDDIDLPQKPNQTGLIRKLYLDPTASHLLITTTTGENFYLHTQSRQVRQLGRLKGVMVECVAWNASLPTASTREILLGASDGSVLETFIEPQGRSHEKYVRQVYAVQDGGGITGIYTDVLDGSGPETRRVLIATHTKLLHFSGRGNGAGGSRWGHESGSVYTKLFEGEQPAVYEIERGTGAAAASTLAISPDPLEMTSSQPAPDVSNSARTYAWLSSQGILSGKLTSSATDPSALGRQILRDSKLLPVSDLPPTQSATGRNRATQAPISSIALTQFHTLVLQDGRLAAINQLDKTIVYNQAVLEPGESNLGLFTDHQKNTFWLFTSGEIFEIVVTDEDRNVWKILLQQGDFTQAQLRAKTPEQRDAVTSALGENLLARGKYAEAAEVLGKCTKAFEDVALQFIDSGEQDALRKYLLIKLAAMKKGNQMQRILLASWLVELYMAKLNQLDDTISTRAELATSSSDGRVAPASAADVEKQLPISRREYQNFVSKHKTDLDRKTTYEIISAHGREEELLYFANVVEDYNYVLSYWVQREKWTEAMGVLKKQTSAEMFYRYSTVMMAHQPAEMTDILMRQSDLDVKKIIPALLNYNHIHGSAVSLQQNQAIRYLQFCINNAHLVEPAVHNTLISMYAAHPMKDETALLRYLETQESAHEQHYDADFALRLCISHDRVRSAVHVYRTMGQHAAAVDLALKGDHVELAADVADGVQHDHVLRKKLWLKIAKKVIGREKGIKAAMDFLKRSSQGMRAAGDARGVGEEESLLRIEDLIPLFPDFIIIDDFKDEICSALQEYSHRIATLKQEMDAHAATAAHIKRDITQLESRYAIVEPGERCWKCRLPLLQRGFFVFPCQHGFHADCLGKMVMRQGGQGKAKRIRELQRAVERGTIAEKRRDGLSRELDGLVAGACVLCSEMAVKGIDEPFVLEGEDNGEWDL